MKWIMIGVLVILPSLVYLNCLHNDFVYDDFHLVSQNRGIQGLHKLPFIFGVEKKAGSYRPVRMASYALDYFLNKNLWGHLEGLVGKYEGDDEGLNPFGFHFSNLVYHVITVLLVFLVINALTDNIRVAFLAALLFSLHPVHTESVAYISGRRDILSTLFYLLGFYFFIRYRASSRLSYSALFLLCYLLALASKEMAVTLPLLCFCYDMVGTLQITGTEKKAGSFNSIFGAIKKVGVTYRYFYLMFLIAAASFTYYKVWINSPSQRHSLYGESILLHFLTVFKIMIHYLRLMFYPVNLTADYSYNGFPIASSLFDPAVLTAILILACILYGLLRLLITSSLMSLGILWWFLALLPVCQIFTHHELMAEHYLYLPSVGLFLFIALVVVKGLETGKWRVMVYSSLCVIVVLLSVRVTYRNRDWKDAITLWEKTVKVVPNCVRAQNNLGVWYYEKGKYQEAKERHLVALRVNPHSADSQNNLGNAYLAQGLNNEAEESYKKAVEIDPDYEKAYSNLGMVYIKEKRYEDAIVQFRKALKLKPRFAKPYYGIALIEILTKDSIEYPDLALKWAMIGFRKATRYDPKLAEAHSNLGSIYIVKGRYEEAEQSLLTAIRLRPDLSEAHNNLAELYEIMGRKDNATETYARALALSPDSGEAHYRLGILYKKKAEYARALSEFKKALSLQFDCAEIHNELGIVYKVQGNYKEAVSEYKKALFLSPEYVEAHYNIAIAYQGMGVDDEALKHYQRVLKLKPKFTQALNNMGGVYARRGNYEKAIALFKKVIAIHPDHALAHNNLGNVYREQTRFSEAIKEYETAARLNSSYGDPHFNLAQIYLKDLKDVERALYHFKKSMAVDPRHPRVAALRKRVENLEKMAGQPPLLQD